MWCLGLKTNYITTGWQSFEQQYVWKISKAFRWRESYCFSRVGCGGQMSQGNVSLSAWKPNAQDRGGAQGLCSGRVWRLELSLERHHLRDLDRWACPEESNGVTNGTGTLKEWMEELGQFNLENRKTGLGKYGMGRGSLRILGGLPGRRGNKLCFAAEGRVRIGYRDTDLTHDWE